MSIKLFYVIHPFKKGDETIQGGSILSTKTVMHAGNNALLANFDNNLSGQASGAVKIWVKPG